MRMPEYPTGRQEIRSIVTRADFVMRQIWVRILLLTPSSCVGLGPQPLSLRFPGCYMGAVTVLTS